MRGLWSSLAAVLVLANCAHAQTTTGRIGTGAPKGVATSNGSITPLPGAISNISPVDGATGVTITPTLSFTSTSAVTYYLKIDTFNPPTDQVQLNSNPSYSPTLSYATTYYWQACAINVIGTTCSTVLSFTTASAPGGVPTSVTVLTPSTGATGVSVIPSISCSADSADTYAILFGTVNPPVTSHSLGATCAYFPGSPTPLSYSTTYYVQAVATNAIGSASSAVTTFTTAADPGPVSFTSRPRLLLTSAKRTELSARRVANTQEWQDVKAVADNLVADVPALTHETTISGALGIGGAGTTFTVADGSAFPTVEAKYRIDLEIITATRSGNTLTITERGLEPAYMWGEFSQVIAHASGAEIWEYVYLEPTNLSNDGPTLALMEQAGATGYEQAARAVTGQLMAVWGTLVDYAAPVNSPYNRGNRHSGNDIRFGWYYTALAYDWAYTHFSTNEKSWFVPLQADVLEWHLANAQECVVWTDFVCSTLRQRRFETALSGNIAAGQLRSELALAANIAGDYGNATVDWVAAYTKVVAYGIPALQDGPLSGGSPPEGTEYGPQVHAHWIDIGNILASATSDTSYSSTFDAWFLAVAKHLLYVTLPNQTNSSTYAFCTSTTGSTTLTCSDTGDLAVGQHIIHRFMDFFTAYQGLATIGATTTDLTPTGYTPIADDVNGYIDIVCNAGAGCDGHVDNGRYQITAIVGAAWRLNRAIGDAGYVFTGGNGNGAGWYLPYDQNNVVTAISGGTVTVARPAVFHTVSGVNYVQHRQTEMTYGDNENSNTGLDDAPLGQDMQWVGPGVIDRLRTSNATYAGYIKYWLDHYQAAANNSYKFIRLIYYDASVSATDYTAASLPKGLVTTSPTATGLVIARSDWTTSASYAYFKVGGEAFNHQTQDANTIGLSRRNIWLNRTETGYGPGGLSRPYVHGAAFTPYGDACFAAFWCANGVVMNGHGGASPVSTMNTQGPATMTRGEVGASNAYVSARGDASGLYYALSSQWTGLGYANDNARGFVRDFLYIPAADILVLHDRMTYSAASVSPTSWRAIYPADPSLSSQRDTVTYAGQKLTNDWVLPAGATLTKVDMKAAEDTALNGYRREVVSGANTATELGMQVMQAMASGDSPLAVTTLTTTNADVVEVGTAYVLGGIPPGLSPTLPITYTCSGTPTQILTGFAVSTAYHVTNSTCSVTIAVATGSGDTTTTAGGVLKF